MIEPIDKTKRRQKTTKDRTGRQTEMTTERQGDGKAEKNKKQRKTRTRTKTRGQQGLYKKGIKLETRERVQTGSRVDCSHLIPVLPVVCRHQIKCRKMQEIERNTPPSSITLTNQTAVTRHLFFSGSILQKKPYHLFASRIRRVFRPGGGKRASETDETNDTKKGGFCRSSHQS